MGIEKVDKRFALIANNGEVLFPYMKSQESTGRYGFALTAPGERDRHGGGTYTGDIEEVIKRMVFDGWGVRAMTTHRSGKQRDGSVCIGKSSIIGYWLAEELKPLVVGAKMAPSVMPGSSPVSENLSSQDSSRHIVNTLPAQSVTGATTPNEEANNNSKHLNEDMDDSSLLADLDELDSGGIDDNDPTERWDNRMSRIGQGKFRKNTIATWGGEERCAVTGIAIREVLTASHIIPWSKDVVQRKRGCNGILLTAHLDRLFDRHLIGFRVTPEVDIYSLVVAPRLADRFLDLAPLGLTVRTALDISTVKRADRPGLETNLRVHLDLVLNNK
jgi:hypothetical protein